MASGIAQSSQEVKIIEIVVCVNYYYELGIQFCDVRVAERDLRFASTTLLKPVWIIMIAALGAVVAAAIGEALLWMVAPIPERPRTTYVLRHAIAGVQQDVAITRDSTGLRIGDGWTEPDDLHPSGASRRLRVLFLGAESTRAPLQNAGETWWGRIGARLADDIPSRQIECAAWGEQEKTIIDSLRWLRTFHQTEQPDIVVLYCGVEDVISHGFSYYFDERKLTQSLPVPDRSLVERGRPYSQIVRRLAAAQERQDAAAFALQVGSTNFYDREIASRREGYPSLPVAGEIVRDIDPEKEFGQCLDAIAQLCQLRGIKLVAVGEVTALQPKITPDLGTRLHRYVQAGGGKSGRARPDPDWVDSELARYYQSGEWICSGHGFPFIDLRGKIPATTEFFYDETVLTDSGSERLAELLYPFVAEAAERVMEED